MRVTHPNSVVCKVFTDDIASSTTNLFNFNKEHFIIEEGFSTSGTEGVLYYSLRPIM
jgi:hypothetical protein